MVFYSTDVFISINSDVNYLLTMFKYIFYFEL